MCIILGCIKFTEVDTECLGDCLKISKASNQCLTRIGKINLIIHTYSKAFIYCLKFFLNQYQLNLFL